ncbi:dynein axonemal assembly factor 6-like [Styela clava]|uniref:dynein assembly factor 6, axonemal-like n=1 Tax=Styela clava TaxID=7725 RepID=UPI001939A2C6|nr:dynein assembly factor 6, axonemal-like [Styela clava]
MADLSVSNISNLQALSNMLNPKEDSSDDDMPESGPSAYTPASIGPTKKVSSTEPLNKKDSQAIWDEEEVLTSTLYQDDDDGRPQPEFDISYKQKVSSEDMFLGSTGKNPSSACCESLVIKIKLPDTKMKDVDLQVKEHVLDCRSDKYKLILPLPHPVDPDKGSAKFDSATHTLVVTLSMKREYDFINFQG